MLPVDPRETQCGFCCCHGGAAQIQVESIEIMPAGLTDIYTVEEWRSLAAEFARIMHGQEIIIRAPVDVDFRQLPLLDIMPNSFIH